ncbi:MAG: hypothetical protein AB7O59_22740 [Pirellulales bacterium]
MTTLAVCGCRSTGGGSSNWHMPWSRKHADAAQSETMSGPELPSANAMPGGAPAGGYDSYNAPPSGGYDQANAGGYPANSYQALPAGAYPAAPPPAGAYGTGAEANGYGSTATNGAGAYAVAPQAGPYPEATAQPAADAYGAAPPTDVYAAPAGQPAAAAPPAAQMHSPAAGGSAPPLAAATTPDGSGGYTITNPYATGGAAGGAAATNPSAPADRYAAGAAPAAQPDAAAAMPTDQTTGAPPQDAAQYANQPAAAGADRYQPGNTGYNPGQTGYAPPGVASYQPAAPPNVVGASGREPHYRPGTTSDYLPSSNSQSPAGSTDRYGVPSTATAPGWSNSY